MQGRFFQRGMTLSERFFRMFNADRSHIHHILDVRYGSHARSLITVWAITLLFALAGILTVFQSTKIWGYSVGIISALLMIVLRFAGLGSGHRREDVSDPTASIPTRS